jgi:hypothetical protein
MTFAKTVLFCMAYGLLCCAAASAQTIGAHSQLQYDWVPDQVSATYQWTLDDYSLQTSASSVSRITLQGGTVEYAWRHYYPWEVVAVAQYSTGNPLAQSMGTVALGAGYCRRFVRWTPFGRVQAGIARTSSSQNMYLYSGPRTGFATVLSAGGDYQLSPHWGIRAIQVQNEYLPYGSRGSVYWSAGAGVTYRIRP